VQRTHTHEVTPSGEDIDGLGHVHNLVYLKWALDAALAHSRALGWDMEAYRRIGGVFVVRKHEIEYLRPAFAGETIQVTTWVETMAAASSLRRTKIVRPSDGAELARVATMWAFIDLESGRPRRIPDEIKASFPLVAPAQSAAAANDHEKRHPDGDQ
jgi:acyl-CoA thioester hydrolase